MSRPARPQPRELVDGWPDVPGVDPVGEVARQFGNNVRAAIGQRSIRAAALQAGVDHSTILAIMQGRTWPDLATIAKLERGWGVDLWPGRLDPD